MSVFFLICSFLVFPYMCHVSEFYACTFPLKTASAFFFFGGGGTVRKFPPTQTGHTCIWCSLSNITRGNSEPKKRKGRDRFEGS